MDTVTEADTASAWPGRRIGFHPPQPRDQIQAMEVDRSKVGKRHDRRSGHHPPDQKVAEVLTLMEQYRISGVPVVKGDQLVGIVTNRDCGLNPTWTKRSRRS